MKSYLKCKKIDTAIRKAKSMLIKKAKKNGLYENFGEKEVREIENKFIDISSYTDEMNLNRDKLNIFNEWCMSCDLSMI
jgi:hypothetical protein